MKTGVLDIENLSLLNSVFIRFIRSFLGGTDASHIKFLECVRLWLKLLVCVLRHVIHPFNSNNRDDLNNFCNYSEFLGSPFNVNRFVSQK